MAHPVDPLLMLFLLLVKLDYTYLYVHNVLLLFSYFCSTDMKSMYFFHKFSCRNIRNN